MTSLVGIIFSIVLIMILAFKNVPLYVYAPFCAIIVALFSKMNPFETLSEVFVTGLGDYVAQNFLLFLSSAVFAAFMEESGAAKYIALRLASLAMRSKQSQFAGLL